MGTREVQSIQPLTIDCAPDIAASEALLRSILATVPDAMIIIDTQGVITYFSAAAERMFGYASDEVRGRNIDILMPSPDRERHDSYIRRYLETGQARIIGIGRFSVGRRRNGETFPMQLSIGEARTDDGRVFTGFIRDLTEREEARVHLEELQNELAHVSRVSAMGTMASSLAHELNQPLTALSAYGTACEELLARGDTGEPLRNAIRLMVSESFRAAEVVRRLRDFFRTGTTRLEPVPLGELLPVAAGPFRARAEQDGVDLALTSAPEGVVMADRPQIEVVIRNLLSNAFDAVAAQPPGKRRVSLSAEPEGPDRVCIKVEDSGPGLSGVAAARLFEPFSSTKSSGLGLGLAISRAIAEAHGGSLRAEVGGHGVFRLQLPFERTAPNA